MEGLRTGQHDPETLRQRVSLICLLVCLLACLVACLFLVAAFLWDVC